MAIDAVDREVGAGGERAGEGVRLLDVLAERDAQPGVIFKTQIEQLTFR